MRSPSSRNSAVRRSEITRSVVSTTALKMPSTAPLSPTIAENE